MDLRRLKATKLKKGSYVIAPTLQLSPSLVSQSSSQEGQIYPFSFTFHIYQQISLASIKIDAELTHYSTFTATLPNPDGHLVWIASTVSVSASVLVFSHISR